MVGIPVWRQQIWEHIIQADFQDGSLLNSNLGVLQGALSLTHVKITSLVHVKITSLVHV